MKNPISLTMVLLALLTPVGIPNASAQFGGLFGRTKVETIETPDLYKFIQRQREAEAKARQAVWKGIAEG